jgi:phospholipid/cholesterol/gamma-HCH transport system ATP-binding protein
MKASPAISFGKVSKAFGNIDVLKDVSFEISEGEALCILGRSGTGKSVTLKLIIGLLKPDEGTVCIQDQNIVGIEQDKLSAVRRRMGFLFQSAALFDSFSVNDNLALPLERFTKKSKAEINSLIEQRLKDVGLGQDRHKMPVELSGGMRKRAGLARALILDPHILLVDEPSSGLDRITSSEIDELLLSIKKKDKTTMVIVTHDIREARRVGDRIAVLDQAGLVGIGTAQELEGHGNELVKALVSEKDCHAH